MNDDMIIQLTDGYKEGTEMYLQAHKAHKAQKAHKAHIAQKTRTFITKSYDDITNTGKVIYVKRRYFAQFIPLLYNVFMIFYDINRQCVNTQTYIPILLGIYVMLKIC
jgi:hypothetical protein